MMDRIFPGIIAGIIVLSAGFLLFYLFIEYYVRKRLKGDHSIDEKMKKLDDVLPLIDDIIKKGVELDYNHTPEYIGSDGDRMLAREIEIVPELSGTTTEEREIEIPETEIQVMTENPKDGRMTELFETLYEKL